MACFPGSPVAGLCTEEAVITTRAVGAKFVFILVKWQLLSHRLKSSLYLLWLPNKAFEISKTNEL